MAPDASRFKAAGIDACRQLVNIRGKNAHSNKFTALYELIDNATSPSAKASRVDVDMTTTVRPEAYRTHGRNGNVSFQSMLSHSCTNLNLLCSKTEAALLQVQYLRVKDDGLGIQSLSAAFTLAGSTKNEFHDDEIGQYGKGLNYATWHIGDDCFVMSV